MSAKLQNGRPDQKPIQWRAGRRRQNIMTLIKPR